MLLTLTVINASAAKVTPIPSGMEDSADYLLKVPDEGNYIYYVEFCHFLQLFFQTNIRLFVRDPSYKLVCAEKPGP